MVVMQPIAVIGAVATVSTGPNMAHKTKLYTKKQHHKRRTAEAKVKRDQARAERRVEGYDDDTIEAMMKGIRDAK